MNYKVEMILAMILRDGRYSGHVTIVPFHCTQQMEKAFLFYRNCEQYDSLRKSVDASCKTFVEGLRKEGKGADEIKVAEEKYMKTNWKTRFYDLSKEEWIQKYNVIQRVIITDYLDKNAEIMQRKILVFPINRGGDHWVSTFVFNPGNVLSKPASLRTCFFRYCSLNPEGNGNLDHEYGIAWILNLAHSCYIFNSKKADSDEGFRLQFPFGHELDGSLQGTPEFSAMKVRKDAHLVLPRQYDGYSCGVGIAAGITIVLNSLLGRSLTNEGDIEGKGIDSCFSSIFQCDNLKVHLVFKKKGKAVKEAVCYFPTELFPPLLCALEQ